MSNFIDNHKEHKELFEGATLTIGQIHKYLVTAENVYRKNDYEPKNIYRWWIKEKEKSIDELEEKTRTILDLLEEFRDQMEKLNKLTNFNSYSEIIHHLNTFTEEHSRIINELLLYVEFLNKKDIIALYMLYYWDIWRSGKNDMISRRRDEIPQNDPKFDEYCVEFAVGVKDGHGTLIYEKIMGDIYSNIADSVNLEFTSQRSLPDISNQIILPAGLKIISNYSLFFSNLRKCMRKILEKIDEYWNKDYPEVKLEVQINEIKNEIFRMISEDTRTKKQFNAVLDYLLSIYGSHQVEPFFKTGEKVKEKQFHQKVYRLLYSRFGEKIEDHKKVGKGDIDFLIYNYPLDVKVEIHKQDIEQIYFAHKDQLKLYCYLRKAKIGFLFVYDNTKKTPNFSRKDFDVYEEENSIIIVILLRGNFPYPSTFKRNS